MSNLLVRLVASEAPKAGRPRLTTAALQTRRTSFGEIDMSLKKKLGLLIGH